MKNLHSEYGSSAMRSLARLVGILLLLALLSGCGLGRQLAPVSILAPEVATGFGHDLDSVEWGLQVRRPVADRMRDSERVLIRTAPSRLQAYPGAAWLDNAPDLLQALTVQALEDSGRFAGVGRAGELRTRLALSTELRRFEGVDDGGPDLSAELVVQANLVSQPTGRVVASNTFRVTERSTGKDLDPLVAAFERAMRQYVEALLPWLIEEGQHAYERGEERAREWRERRGG